MTRLLLSRYLYFCDEVVLTLIDCLLEKRSLKEALFWLGEYYFTGFHKECWLLVWTIYFDFYALLNPRFSKKMSKLSKQEDTIDNLLYIIKNLFHMRASYHVFMFRVKKYKFPLVVYPNKTRYKWLNYFNNLTLLDKNLIISIKKRTIANVTYYLHQYTTDDYFDVIRQYFKVIEKSEIQENTEFPNSLKKNYILYYMLSHFNVLTPIQRQIYIRVTPKEKKQSHTTNEDTIEGAGRYKVLKSKRIFPISKSIGCFNLCREAVYIANRRMLSIQHIYWYHWLYFASFTPLWKNRLREYKAELIKETCSIEFPTDDLLETFYDTYGLEPDEQSKENQEMSILTIPDDNIANWLNNKFNLLLSTKDIRCSKINY